MSWFSSFPTAKKKPSELFTRILNQGLTVNELSSASYSERQKVMFVFHHENVFSFSSEITFFFADVSKGTQTKEKITLFNLFIKLFSQYIFPLRLTNPTVINEKVKL